MGNQWGIALNQKSFNRFEGVTPDLTSHLAEI